MTMKRLNKQTIIHLVRPTLKRVIFQCLGNNGIDNKIHSRTSTRALITNSLYIFVEGSDQHINNQSVIKHFVYPLSQLCVA